jgi:sortase A
MRDELFVRANGHGRWLVWAERLLILIGLAALSWCAFVIGDALVAQRWAREIFEAQSREERVPAAPASSSRHGAKIPSAGSDVPMTALMPLAELSIPRLHLAAMVLQGTDARTLRVGVGHVERSPLPGERGNVVIAGHRDTFFWPLRNVQVGDEIRLTTRGGPVVYRVSTLRVVQPTDLAALAATPDDILTLITCYPFWVIGPAQDRLIVRATRVNDQPKRTALIARQLTATRLDKEPPALEGLSPPSAAPVPLPLRADADDRVEVRQAIERFRTAFNVRLAREHVADAAEPLGGAACEVAVDDDVATAVCKWTAMASHEPRPAWTFVLRKAAGQWSIASFSQEDVRERTNAAREQP